MVATDNGRIEWPLLKDSISEKLELIHICIDLDFFGTNGKNIQLTILRQIRSGSGCILSRGRSH